MRACVRDSDSIARLGGDEFAVLQVPSEQIADATSLAKRLIASVSAPYQIDGHEVIIGVSIGIAIAPADGATSQQLMKKADKALYRSKGTGGNSYRFVSEEFARKNLQLSPPTSGRHRANA
jgi:diguanylate cyclase (GGDEF)-like protein